MQTLPMSNGMYVKVRAYPGMKKERVTKLAPDSYEIVVREPAERNLANHRIRTLIAKEYGVKDTQVQLVTGHRSPSKVLSVEAG